MEDIVVESIFPSQAGGEFYLASASFYFIILEKLLWVSELDGISLLFYCLLISAVLGIQKRASLMHRSKCTTAKLHPHSCTLGFCAWEEVIIPVINVAVRILCTQNSPGISDILSKCSIFIFLFSATTPWSLKTAFHLYHISLKSRKSLRTKGKVYIVKEKLVLTLVCVMCAHAWHTVNAWWTVADTVQKLFAGKEPTKEEKLLTHILLTRMYTNYFGFLNSQESVLSP